MSEKLSYQSELYSCFIFFQIGALYDIFCAILRMPGVQNHRFVLEPMSKLISHSLQNFNIPFHNIVSVCHLCNKSFLKASNIHSYTSRFSLIQKPQTFSQGLKNSTKLFSSNVQVSKVPWNQNYQVQSFRYWKTFVSKAHF